jgi:hypothetical protein
MTISTRPAAKADAPQMAALLNRFRKRLDLRQGAEGAVILPQ